jgi:hypothetical protein
MNEFEMLNLVVGGQKLKDMTAFGFLQWMANKLTNIKSFSPESIELTSLTQSPPMSKNMPDERKVDILKKLIKLGIQIP